MDSIPVDFAPALEGAALLIGGARVSPVCGSDAEVEYHIRRLKEELDAIGVQWKARAQDERAKTAFDVGNF